MFQTPARQLTPKRHRPQSTESSSIKCSSLSPFSLRTYVGAPFTSRKQKAFRQGFYRYMLTILSIYVKVFPRLTVPSFFAREKLPTVQGGSLAGQASGSSASCA